jgi:hypothetical protein
LRKFVPHPLLFSVLRRLKITGFIFRHQSPKSRAGDPNHFLAESRHAADSLVRRSKLPSRRFDEVEDELSMKSGELSSKIAAVDEILMSHIIPEQLRGLLG